MPGTVSGNQVASFSAPTNGTTADADQVRSNDNTLRTAFNAHDADATIHVQSSTLASRPAAGTAGRVWVTTDSSVPRLWYDNGSSWLELDYLNQTQGGTVTGDLTVSGATSVQGLTATTITATRSGAETTVVTVNNTHASSQGGGISYQQGGTQRGYSGVSGVWLGTTASDVALAAGTGSTIKFFTNNSVTAGMTLSTANDLNVVGGITATSLTASSGGATITGDSSVTGDLAVSGTITGTIAGVSTYDRATSDVPFTSSTDLGLTFAIGAAEVWEVEYVLVHSNAGVAGATASFDIGVPASATGVQFAVGGDGTGSGTGTISQVHTSFASSFTGFPAGTSAGNPGHIHIRATVIGGGTAGDVTIAATASSGTGTLKAGSFVRTTKLA